MLLPSARGTRQNRLLTQPAATEPALRFQRSTSVCAANRHKPNGARPWFTAETGRHWNRQPSHICKGAESSFDVEYVVPPRDGKLESTQLRESLRNQVTPPSWACSPLVHQGPHKDQSQLEYLSSWLIFLSYSFYPLNSAVILHYATL